MLRPWKLLWWFFILTVLGAIVFTILRSSGFSSLSGCEVVYNGWQKPRWKQPTIEYRVAFETIPEYLDLKEAALRDLVRWAFASWQAVEPAVPIALESDAAWSKIVFGPMAASDRSGEARFGPNDFRTAPEIKWFTLTLSNRENLFSLQRQTNRIHLPSLLLHEVGHVFLGDGHLTKPDQVMFSSLGPGQVRTTFSACDLALIRQKY